MTPWLFGCRDWACLVALVGVMSSCLAGPTSLGDAPFAADTSAAAIPHAAGASVPAGDAKSSAAANARLNDPPAGPAVSYAADRSDTDSGPRSLFVGSQNQAGAERPVAGNARPQSPEAESAIKELTTSALGWVHDVLPWGSKEERVVPQMAKVPIENLVLPIETENGGLPSVKLREEAGMAQGAGMSGATATGAIDPVSRTRGNEPQAENSTHQLIKLGREVMTHPLTWLVVILICIAQIVVSRAGRGK